MTRKEKRRRCKRILDALIVTTVIVALAVCWHFFRLEVIRATLHLPLPGWLKRFLWGW